MPSDPLRPRVSGVGIACLDYLFLAPACAPGEQAPLRDYCVAGGGLVGTALVAAARLGAHAAIRTWVGDDPEGEQVIRGLWEEKVDTSGVEVVIGGHTPVSFVHVDAATGERTIYHPPHLRVAAPQLHGVVERALGCDVLLLDAIWPEASLAAARAARWEGLPIVADFTPSPELCELTALVNNLIVPRAGAERLAPGASYREKLDAIAAMGVEFPAITAGAEGCYYLDNGDIRHQPAFSVPVIDTTGAGDCFHGAFAYAVGRGWDRPRSIEFASAVSALSCRALGGRQALPKLDQVLEFLSQHGRSGW